MKRLPMLLLLVSLGLNLGLGYTVFSGKQAERTSDRPEFDQTRAGRPGFRNYSGRDSAFNTDRATRRLDALTSKLELDQDQVTAFKTIQLEAYEMIHQQRSLARQSRSRLHGLCVAGESDPDSIRQAVSELNSHHSRLDSLVTETLLAELAVLSPEQRERYLSRMPWEIGPGQQQRGGRQRGQHHKGGGKPREMGQQRGR